MIESPFVFERYSGLFPVTTIACNVMMQPFLVTVPLPLKLVPPGADAQGYVKRLK
jgi:hypothetical protein